MGHDVSCCSSAPEALQVIDSTTFDCIVTDLQMPELNGLELVAAVKESMPSIPMILTTSVGSEEIAAQALRAGASSYVPKRDMSSALGAVVRQVLAVNEATRSVREVAKFAIENRAVTYFAAIIMVVGGIFSFFGLGQVRQYWLPKRMFLWYPWGSSCLKNLRG